MTQSGFVPDTPKDEVKVPYFDDVSKEDGWQGHTTTKSLKVLQAEISNAIARLGGHVSSFQGGKFGDRDGFQIHYLMSSTDGAAIPGRINIAALPVRSSWRRRSNPKDRREKSLKMALYMLRMALDGTWFLQQLSPGYAALMPFMIGKDGRTISELWSDSSTMNNLLPPPEDDFEVTEGKIIG